MTNPGDRAVAFVRALKHTKGKWAGLRFGLQPWQEEILRAIFGQVENGKRRVRTSYLEVPRKNGKTELAAGIALYMLFADGEKGAEIYSAAADRDQASLVFNAAAQMVRASKVLSGRCKIIDSQKRIVVPESASFYRALSAEAYTKHGLNASGIIFDELHAQPNRELWDVLATSQGAREQPLTLAITTAGWDRNSICWEMHEYARKVSDGVVEDPTFHGAIYGAAEEEDWTDPEVWARANPNLGVSVHPEFLETECARAKENPAAENVFRRLYLNQWTRQETRWIPLAAWDACREEIDWEAYRGRECYAGLDLSATTDLTALLLVFPPEVEGGAYLARPFFWVPADTLELRERRDHVPVEYWVRAGYLEPTPGNVIDTDWILRRLGELMEAYQIRELAFDRWGSQKIVADLQTRLDFTVDEREAELGGRPLLVQFGQGFASMGSPTKTFEELVLGRRIHHDGNPVLRWNVDSAVVDTDAAGNRKPNKAKSTSRIDGLVALLMGLERASARQSQASVYETRGVLSFGGA